jgi:hypothetical protein
MFNSLCTSLIEMIEKYPDSRDIVIDVFVNQMKYSLWEIKDIIEVLLHVRFVSRNELVIDSLDTMIDDLRNNQKDF